MSTELLTDIEIGTESLLVVLERDFGSAGRITSSPADFFDVEQALRGFRNFLATCQVLSGVDDEHSVVPVEYPLGKTVIPIVTTNFDDLLDEEEEHEHHGQDWHARPRGNAYYGGKVIGSAAFHGSGRPYAIKRISMASPLIAIVEFTPFFAAGMGAALLFLAERLVTLKSRTNAINSRNDLETALNRKAIDEVYQGQVDALAIQLRRMENQQLPTEVQLLDPASSEEAEQPQLPSGA